MTTNDRAWLDEWRPGATDHYVWALQRVPGGRLDDHLADPWGKAPPPFWMTAPSVRIAQVVERRDDGAWLPSRSLGGDTGWC
jgi:hypothetical protein